MRIALGHGAFAEIDDGDFDRVKQYPWRVLGAATRYQYAIAQPWVDGKRDTLLMHRIIAGAGPGDVVDHVDGNGLNNRSANLRVCTHAENMRNRAVAVSNALGVLNVYLEIIPSGDTRYVVQIITNGHRVRRRFRSLNDAARAAQFMRRDLHGEFATSQSRAVRDMPRRPSHAIRDGQSPSFQLVPVFS